MRSRSGRRAARLTALSLVMVLLVVEAGPAGARRGPRARASRAVMWSAPLRAEPWGLATDDTVVVATSDLGDVEAFTPAGRPLWSTKVDHIVGGDPALDVQHVFVATEAAIVAFDRTSGRRFWAAVLGIPLRRVAFAGGAVLASSDDGRLLALDPTSGAVRWSVRYDGAVIAPPVADAGGNVVATWHLSDTPTVRSLDRATGALRWETPTGPYSAAPAVAGRTVVIAEGDGDYHAQVRALDAGSGTQLWASAVDASFESGVTPGVSGSDVVVVDHFGMVTLLDLASGRMGWQTPLDRPVLWTRILITDQAVVLTTWARDLVTIDRHTGRVRSAVQPGGPGGVPLAIAPLGATRPSGIVVVLRRTDPPRIEARRQR